jgi:hypothetical protein
MRHHKRGWTKQDEAWEGCTEDGEVKLPELIGEEAFNMWRDQGKELVVKDKDRQWALGEWIVEGEQMKEAAGLTVDQRFKNAVYKSAADITGYSVRTVKSLAYVVRNVRPEVKDRFKVSFAHLKLVASLNGEQQQELLEEMERSDLTVAQGRDKVRFVTGKLPAKTSAADRRARRVIWHCNLLVQVLEDPELGRTSPILYESLVATIANTREALQKALEDAVPVSV